MTRASALGSVNLHINTAITNWDQGPAGQQWPTTESSEAATDTQIASADLMLEKTHKSEYPTRRTSNPNEVVPGTEFDWNIKVTNNGVDNSMGPFVVKDTLPAGTEYKSYSGTDWSCTARSPCTSPAPTR